MTMSTAQAGAAGGQNSAPPISTVAGTGHPGSPKGENERAVSAQLNGPYGVAMDSAGTLYISEYSGHRVRKVTTDGKISTVAGTGAAGRGEGGGLAVSPQLHTPRGVAADTTGASDVQFPAGSACLRM
ncbi:NHL domain-containing protein [Streptomyces lateritius]